MKIEDVTRIARAHAEHRGLCRLSGIGGPCLIGELAEALIVALTERDEARTRAVMLCGIVEKVDEALGVLPYDDCLIDYDRVTDATRSAT